MKVLKWLLGSLAVLVAAAVGYVVWTVETFDTLTPPAHFGGVVSTLFLAQPEKVGSAQPLIVTFGGSEGGNVWASERLRRQRDRFHAQGYAVLAVGYFGMPGTPEELDRISLDAIYAEIQRTAQHEHIDGACIALIGGSRGAELALLLSSYFANIHATVAIVPGSAVFPALNLAMVTPGFSLHGKSLPFVPVPWSVTPALIRGDHRAAFEMMMTNHQAMDDAAIPVERMQGPALFLSASQDSAWPSAEMAEQMMQRLGQHGFAPVAEHVVIEGDHGAPLDHFNVIERFLQENFHPDSPQGCRSGSAPLPINAAMTRP